MKPSAENNKKQTLFLFTAQYPYGTGETFVEGELKIVSEAFSEIYLFALTSDGNARSIPANVKVIDWEKKHIYDGKKVLVKNFLIFSKIWLTEFFASSNKSIVSKDFPELKSSLLQNIARAECVSSYIQEYKKENSVFYTFWFDDWATVLGILKEKAIIKTYQTRVHGFDLYAERRKNGYIPFRNFQMKTVKSIFAVSKDGFNYLNLHYPRYSSKIKLNHLGVFDQGVNPFAAGQPFTIVSCSNLIPLKRVHLIIEILKNIKINARWVHFGDGPLKEQLEEQAKSLPGNISYEFKGQTENAEIMEFYKTQTVNLMLHVSETEGGVSIAMQEAASFGVPLMGTNVGGIPEIVTEETGILLPVDLSVEETARMITTFESGPKNTTEFRAGCRNFWKRTFDADKNYRLFYKQLTGNNS